MEKQPRSTVDRNRRVILFPLPFQGHISPMLQLANILYSKGFTITILHTNFNAPNTSNYPHFTFKSIIDNDPQDQRYSNLPSQGVAAFSRLFVYNQYGANALRDELKQMLVEKDGPEPPVSCLITDAIWHFTQSVAHSLNLPRLVLWTSSLFSFLVYASIPLFEDRGYDKLDITHLEEQVVEFPLLKVKDILKLSIVTKTDSSMEMTGNMVKQSKTSAGIIWNSFEELEGAEFERVSHDFPIPNFLIPFPKLFTSSLNGLLTQDRSFFPWLDQHPPNSVVYVSFGSVCQVEERDFLEIAHGLVDSKQSFLWVVRPGFVKGSVWVEPLPDEVIGEKGRIVKWVPQQEVLGHKAIGAFLTHSGWNSAMETVCEGVAMICSPFWGDQPLIARYMSDFLKVGVCLENVWQREEITSAIRRVMVDEEREDIQERVRVLKQKLHVSLMKGGSSFKSLESLVDYISSFHVIGK